jgi:predicted RNA binding protein YcfA (HicA-like mRNA interferase family)
MNSETVTLAQLERFLVRIGFLVVPTPGPHVLYTHPPTQTEILLPAGHPTELAGRARLAGIRTTVVERGVVEGTVYDARLAEMTGGEHGMSTGTSGPLRVSRP